MSKGLGIDPKMLEEMRERYRNYLTQPDFDSMTADRYFNFMRIKNRFDLLSEILSDMRYRIDEV